MKITNAMVGLLSNSEVLRVLHDRGADASQPTVTARANEQMAYHYLTEHSAGLQDTMALQHFIQLLEPFQLTKAEVVGILNLCPSSAVELHLVVEDCEMRLNEEQIEKILDLVSMHLKH
ncbi:HRDC-like protein [Haematococcus lacustris]